MKEKSSRPGRATGSGKSMAEVLAGISDPRVRKALSLSVTDAILWALMFGLAENNLLPFAIMFGATAFHTSLIQGSAQLGVAIAQLVGERIIQRTRRRKRLALIANIVQGLSWIFVFFGALVFKNPWIILVGYSVGLFAANLAGPGWVSWMNELVPDSIRGSYWGNRNRIAGLIQFGAICAAGFLISRARTLGLETEAFGLLFILAALLRIASILPLSRQYEPEMDSGSSDEAKGLVSFILGLPYNTFGRFVIFSTLITFAVNIMGPAISVFGLKSLGLDYLSYTAIVMSSMVVSFLAMSYWGPLSDRFGNYRILVVTGIFLPFIALAWVIFKSVPALIVVQLLSGFVWAGVNLSTTNYIFDSVPKQSMARGMAYFTALNNFCAFAGSIAGGFLSLAFGRLSIPFFAEGNLELVFITSALLRGLVIILFLRGFEEVRKVEPAPRKRYFYIYQPFYIFMSRFQDFSGDIVDTVSAGSREVMKILSPRGKKKRR